MNGKFFAVIAALALSAPVFADSGFYLQGDAGVGKVKASADGQSVSKSGFSPRLTAGYDFGNNWRAGVDYTRYKNIKYAYEDEYSQENGTTKFHSIGISAIYDFPVSQVVKPYLGARLGINRVSDSYHSVESEDDYTETTLDSFRKTKVGVGVLAGVGVNVTEKVTLDVGYRYNHWGKFDGVKVNSNELSAGVRVKF